MITASLATVKTWSVLSIFSAPVEREVSTHRTGNQEHGMPQCTILRHEKTRLASKLYLGAMVDVT